MKKWSRAGLMCLILSFIVACGGSCSGSLKRGGGGPSLSTGDEQETLSRGGGGDSRDPARRDGGATGGSLAPEDRNEKTAREDARGDRAIVFVERPPTREEERPSTRSIDPPPSPGTARPSRPPVEYDPPPAPARQPPRVVEQETHRAAPIEVAAATTTDEGPGGAQGGGWTYLDGDEALDEGALAALASESRSLGDVYTEPGRLPQLQVVGEVAPDVLPRPGREGDRLLLPLEHTHVEASLRGPAARVVVSQRYRNPYSRTIEAVYVFPLPENSAVDRMRLRVGDRVLEGRVHARQEARAIYEQARAEGHVAALLEQERPNVFTQSVANIAPNRRVSVEVSYVQDLTYDAGRYEFVFPMVVGPRFHPEGGGAAPGTRAPVVGRGTRSGHDISLSLVADAGVTIQSYEAPTHETIGAIDEAGRLSLSLARRDELANRDFVLRYDVAAEQPKATVLSEWSDAAGGGYFTMVVQPPKLDVNALIGTRELIFMVDVSGSMRGVPMAMCKEAMIEALRRLRPVDTFNIVTFAGGTRRLFQDPRPANQRAIQQAIEFVEGMQAGGGTRMLEAVKGVLNEAIEPGIQRSIVFMTDGYIGNEADVLAAIGEGARAAKATQARIRAFAFGVGASPNRYLIEGAAREGEGTAHYALNREDPALAVQSFMRVMDHPIWTDVEVDFGELEVVDLYPTQAGDLFASHPLVIHGRYTRSGRGQVTLRARGQGRPVEVPFDVTLTGAEEGGHAAPRMLGSLWARARIEARERDLLYGAVGHDEAREEIVALAQLHGLVTRFTSFVAVDRSERVSQGSPMRVDQYLEQVEDVGSPD